MLSGHGCFVYYLHRFKKLDDPLCVDCREPIDDAQHVMIRYGRWWKELQALEVEVEESLDPENIIYIMLRKKSNWETVKRFTRHVQSRRENYERSRQNRNLN